MASFAVYFNPSDRLKDKDLVYSIQKVDYDSNDNLQLGNLWDFTNSVWATSPAIGDRTTALPATSDGHCVGYFDSFDLNTTYSGRVAVAVFDNSQTPATDAPIQTEIRYVRRGYEETNHSYRDRVLDPVPDPLVAYLGTRGNNQIVPLNDIVIGDSFSGSVAVDVRRVVSKGVRVSDIVNLTITPTGPTIRALGGHETQAQLDITGNLTTGQTYTINFEAMLTNGEKRECPARIVVKTPYV